MVSDKTGLDHLTYTRLHIPSSRGFHTGVQGTLGGRKSVQAQFSSLCQCAPLNHSRPEQTTHVPPTLTDKTKFLKSRSNTKFLCLSVCNELLGINVTRDP